MMSNQHQAQARVIQTSDEQLFIYQPNNNTQAQPLLMQQIPSPAIGHSKIAPLTTTTIREEVPQNQQNMMVSNGEYQSQQIPITAVINELSPAINDFQIVPQTATAIRKEVPQNMAMVVPNVEHYSDLTQQIPKTAVINKLRIIPSPAINDFQIVPQTATAIRKEVPQNQQNMVMMVPNGEHYMDQSHQIPKTALINKLRMISSPALNRFLIAPRTATAIREEVPQNQQNMAMLVLNGKYYSDKSQQVPTTEKTLFVQPMVYVNPKQYKRILIRRQAKLKLVVEGRIPITRKKYLYKSRHNNAMRRVRRERGRFDSRSLQQRDMSSSENMQNDGNSITTCTITNQQKIDEEQNLQLENGLVYSMNEY